MSKKKNPNLWDEISGRSPNVKDWEKAQNKLNDLYDGNDARSIEKELQSHLAKNDKRPEATYPKTKAVREREAHIQEYAIERAEEDSSMTKEKVLGELILKPAITADMVGNALKPSHGFNQHLWDHLISGGNSPAGNNAIIPTILGYKTSKD